MTQIYFTSENEETRVSGRERAHMGNIVATMGVSPLLTLCEDYGESPPKIINMLPERCYVKQCTSDNHVLKRVFRQWFGSAWDEYQGLTVDGVNYPCFALSLNTTMIMGSDPIKLAARIHGQCEIHTYIEGANRDWVASIIENGLDTNIYHRDVGWEPTATMLKSDNQHPVVLSYSVCEIFPDQYVAHYEDEDAWYALTEHERWELNMAELRKNATWLEIRPDCWKDYEFGNKVNSFTILDKVYGVKNNA